MGLKLPPLPHHISQRDLQARQAENSVLGPRLPSLEDTNWLGLSVELPTFACTSEAGTLRCLGEGIVSPSMSRLDQNWPNKQIADIQRGI